MGVSVPRCHGDLCARLNSVLSALKKGTTRLVVTRMHLALPYSSTVCNWKQNETLSIRTPDFFQTIPLCGLFFFSLLGSLSSWALVGGAGVKDSWKLPIPTATRRREKSKCILLTSCWPSDSRFEVLKTSFLWQVNEKQKDLYLLFRWWCLVTVGFNRCRSWSFANCRLKGRCRKRGCLISFLMFLFLGQ